MDKYCSGCGALLQSDNELLNGFIPKEKYDNSTYCKRCFRLINYGDLNNNNILINNTKLINKINKDKSFKIFIIDLLNINNNTINLYNKIKENKMLLISKYDLYYKIFNKNKLFNKLNLIYNIKKLDTISIKNNIDINKLINYFKNKKINNIMFIGPTNSGKSSIINKILEINNINHDKLTVSNSINTTIDYINIKLNNLNIIDSPGFYINELTIDKDFKNHIKTITYNMKKDEILNIDNFYLKFSNNTSITLYMYKIDSKKYYKDIKFDYEISVKDNTDLCINGLGFINIKKECIISISNIDKELISERMSII